MEVKTSVSEHDNKENIPPFFSPNEPSPDTSKVECTLVKNKEARRPLRDITHLHKAAPQSGQAAFRDFRLPSSVLVYGFSSNRKRKLADDSSEHRSCSKILRRQFR
ncbi:hypothetical protein Pfo_013822 [Paulownia fortunei]|nr:hypothetical protein Pfo_013822 [Paulownia fortunei]